MNKTITLILIVLVSAFSFSASAQNREIIEDSLDMTPGYANDIFYSMTDGEVASVARAGWDLGFYTNAFSAGIIINEGNGVQLFSYPNSDTSGWASFDTTGMMSWQSLSNSNEYWEDGAFNRTSTGHPDYGWGVYNMVTHGLTGDSLYLINIPNVGYKKLWIVDKVSVDNIYHLRFADINGDNEENVELDIKPFTSKNFAYYSMANNELIDREPSDAWDILFTKYIDITYDNEGNPAEYLVTGVTSNINTAASKFTEVSQDFDDWTAKPMDSLKNTIGYDWKYFDMGTFQWTVDDSTVFFVMGNSGDVFKLVFTEWQGSTTGKFSFYKEMVSATSISDIASVNENITVYPNPANDVVNIRMEESLNGDLAIFDITGKLVYTESLLNSTIVSVDVSAFDKGLYFITLTGDNKKESAKFIIN
ncbi:MAG: hypothetical protein C0598_03185 [Marinilabiliales bacterium]|nr:MAG: hypothetical protein C0598_03185 [Marinilabiliales bacterium]